MSTVIRIPLPVQQMHALAGYFTDGPSLMALYGLVSRLEQNANFPVHGFGLVLEEYQSNVWRKEAVLTGLDVVPAQKQTGGRPMTGYRYADMVAALYLETDEVDPFELEALLAQVELEANMSRVQGGNIRQLLMVDSKHRLGIRAEDVQTPEDLAKFIIKCEKPISKIYLSRHLPEALQGDALLEAYAHALTDKDIVLLCNGYRQVGAVQDIFGQQQRLGDAVFTLAQTVPVHQLKREPDKAELLQGFFWAFDQKEHELNPNHFILT